MPQAVAYAQIAGLRPEAGLVAAPGALLGYALLGSSRTLIVSATSATAALSAATVGPLAEGGTSRYVTLSAALAIVTGAAFAAAGLLRLGGVADLISKPVLTGFLFGLGLTIAIGQLSKLFGVPAGSGDFFEQLWDLLSSLGETDALTLVVGAASVAFLVVLGRVAPGLPSSLLLLVGAIVVSSLFDLAGHGVDVVGELPRAIPDPELPDVGWDELVQLLPGAVGIALVGYAEAISVARGAAAAHRYSIDPNRELLGLGLGNALAGLSQGFVQSGGASQSAAADRAGAASRFCGVVAAVLVLLTGAFLTSLFENLPQATLGAIVIVAVTGFFRVDELARFAGIRRSAFVLSLIALVGVLALGILPGLLLAAVLSLVIVIKKLSRPSVGQLARDPETGAYGRVDRHADWQTDPGNLVVWVDGPLFYANAASAKERVLALAEHSDAPVVVLDLSLSAELDVESVDMLGELAEGLQAAGVELQLASVRAPVLDILRRAGITERVRIVPTLEHL